MENQNEQQQELWKNLEQEHRRGKILGGILLVAVGSIFLAKELGVEIPFWLLSWKMLLIALGTITILKNGFRSSWGVLLILVGGAFLMGDFYPQLLIKPLVLPVIVILFGLFIIFKPRKNFRQQHWEKWGKEYGKNWEKEYAYCSTTETSDDDYITSSTYMGALKKSVLSKTFKGGKVKIVCGGVELNLSQADFEGQIVLEIDQLFGGLELIVPAHWEIRSELTTGFSSTEDNRTMQPGIRSDVPKILILKGSNYFGGIEIKNY